MTATKKPAAAAKKNKPATRPGANKASARAPRKIRSKKMINALLLAAAREEFQRCGYVGATTAAIARRAEVTETQLFRHFPSKADLFRAAVFEPLAEHFSTFNKLHPTSHQADIADRDRARLYVGELQDFLGEHSKLLLSLVVAQIFQTGDLTRFEQVDSLEDYFRTGAKLMSHRVEKSSEVDPKLLVRVSFAGLMGCVLFKDWFVPPGMASEEEVSRSIANFMLDGIAMGKQPETVESKTEPRQKRSKAKTTRSATANKK